jgi:AcrR family transcriptional regulator
VGEGTSDRAGSGVEAATLSATRLDRAVSSVFPARTPEPIVPSVAAEASNKAASEGGRARILEAALAVFAERGYNAASIAEIGARAGIAKSVMYHHFGSKAGLYEAIVKAQTADLVKQVAEAVAANSSAPRLRTGVDAYFAFLKSRPTVWRLLFRDPPTDPELIEVHRRLQGQRARSLSSLLTEEKKRGNKDTKLFAELLTTAVRAYATWWLDHPRVTRARVVDAVMDFTEAGVRKLNE